MSDATLASSVFVDANDAITFASSLLTGQGVSAEDSAAIATCLVQADLRGVQTHGMSRLPIYVKRVKRGLVNPVPSMKLTKPMAACASLDGDNGFGFLVGIRAMREAIEMAETCGVGVVSAHNSNHFGMAASYLLQAVTAGYFAFVFTNAAKSMPPWGGREGLFGTSPFGAAAPAGNYHLLCLICRQQLRLEVKSDWLRSALSPFLRVTRLMKMGNQLRTPQLRFVVWYYPSVLTKGREFRC